MKAVQVFGYHKMPMLVEVREPVITDPLDVIVKVGGAGVCRTDLHIIDGQWEDIPGVRLPTTLGHENAGWVHQVGSAVTHLKVGDPVILHPISTCGFCAACRAGDDVHCLNGINIGVNADGGYAEFLKTSARAAVKLEPTQRPAEVAALADAGLTAYHAVAKAVRILRPGDKIVMIGAGGLGHIGIQVLRALSSVEMIVVDRSSEALELAASLGAHHTVLADGDQIAKVLELTDGFGAEAVIDFVGEGGSIADGIQMLRRAGSFLVVGYGGEVRVSTMRIMSNEINFIGNLIGTYSELAELMALAAQGLVKLHTQEYRLTEFATALNDLDQGRVRGRAILVP